MRVYAGLFETLNVNKRSVVLDLKDPEGKRRALELAADADVVIEGFRPGVAARLGVGYDDVREVNASVVYCSVSGMGQRGPLTLVPGHDLNYQAWAGVLVPDGGPPVVAAVPLADLAGGMAAAFAVAQRWYASSGPARGNTSTWRWPTFSRRGPERRGRRPERRPGDERRAGLWHVRDT